MELNNCSYYIPDPIWESFGINNQTEHVERYVIKAKFHHAVHKDILLSYETVEYLMAHSYYHWPMYDEAKKKLLGIFEMAVKLRNAELGNDLTFKDKKEKIHQKKLNKLIDDLADFGYSDGYINELHWIRVNRNSEAHPDRHGFGGAIFMRGFYPIINAINELFLHPEMLNETIEKTKNLVEKYADSISGLYVVPFKGQLVLAYDPEIIHCWKIHETWVTAVYFRPVLKNTKETIELHKIEEPILLLLSEIDLSNETIKAINTESGEKIIINKTSLPVNVDLYNLHLTKWQQLNEVDKNIYNLIHRREFKLKIEMSIYQSWQNH